MTLVVHQDARMRVEGAAPSGTCRGSWLVTGRRGRAGRCCAFVGGKAPIESTEGHAHGPTQQACRLIYGWGIVLTITFVVRADFCIALIHRTLVALHGGAVGI